MHTIREAYTHAHIYAHMCVRHAHKPFDFASTVVSNSSKTIITDIY